MKLFGNSSKSRHAAGRTGGAAHSGGTGGEHAAKKSSGGKHLSAAAVKKNKIIKIIILVLVILAALCLAVLAWWKANVKPPDVSDVKKPPVVNTDNNTDPTPQVTPDDKDPDTVPTDTEQENPDAEQPGGRSGQKYTFAVLGTDDGNGNTDTIMVATFDTESYEINVVSIPRDTMVNVSWNTKKINSLYGVGGLDRTMKGLADILGFELDFYVVVDLEACVKLVDAIGGVYYDVPENMKYSDPAQDLYIDISKGPQMINGKDAVKILRFRGYASADIGRISTQQDFLKTAAQQIMENKSKLNISTLADVFLNYVDTDLTYGNIIWFAQEFFKMDMENITFHTLPGNYGDSVNGNSYVSIYVNEWLTMINELLNPYDDAVKVSELNILTRDRNTGKIYPTNGHYAGSASWGNVKPEPETPPTEDPVTPPEDPVTPGPEEPENPTDPTDPTDIPQPPEGEGTGDVPVDGGEPDDGSDATTGTEPDDGDPAQGDAGLQPAA